MGAAEGFAAFGAGAQGRGLCPPVHTPSDAQRSREPSPPIRSRRCSAPARLRPGRSHRRRSGPGRADDRRGPRARTPRRAARPVRRAGDRARLGPARDVALPHGRHPGHSLRGRHPAHRGRRQPGDRTGRRQSVGPLDGGPRIPRQTAARSPPAPRAIPAERPAAARGPSANRRGRPGRRSLLPGQEGPSPPSRPAAWRSALRYALPGRPGGLPVAAACSAGSKGMTASGRRSASA